MRHETLCLAATILLPSPAFADASLDKARAIMVAMQGEFCTAEPAPDEEWADKSWPLTWRYEYQSPEEPDKKGRLLRLYCDHGAYNVRHAWFREDEEGVTPLSFAMPAFDVARATDEFDSAVTGIKVTGFRSENMLVNSDFDPARGVVVMTSLWRGMGDAMSAGEWRMIEGDPVLKLFEVDASYDGEQTPEAIYRAE